MFYIVLVKRNFGIVFFVLLISLIFLSCDNKVVPFEINKKIIYNQECGNVLFSSNKQGYFIPSLISSVFSNSRKIQDLDFDLNRNTYPRDISSDCTCGVFLAERSKKNGYDVILYNFYNKNKTNITSGSNAEFSDPIMVGKDSILVIENKKIRLFNINKNNWSHIASSADFRFLFKGHGYNIYLQDFEGNIWSLDYVSHEFRKIWNSPTEFVGSRQVKFNQGKLYFLSDHVNGYNSIFVLDEAKKIVVDSIVENNDIFLLQQFSKNSNISYIRNKGLSFSSDSVLVKSNGVLYDAVRKGDSILMLYSDLTKPASLFLNYHGELVDILKQQFDVKPYRVETISKLEGVDDMVLFPLKEVKSWVVWLHGGPNEQVSFRYNRYFYSLLENGIGVIAINYPGSTGKGNKIELLGVSAEKSLNYQVQSINDDLEKIIQKNKIKNISLIGVSYGGKIAQKLIQSGRHNFDKFIDFSGIGTDPSFFTKGVNTLYIFGDGDFMLYNKDRVEMLNIHKDSGAKIRILENEGHAIASKDNISNVCKEILTFLKE